MTAAINRAALSFLKPVHHDHDTKLVSPTTLALACILTEASTAFVQRQPQGNGRALANVEQACWHGPGRSKDDESTGYTGTVKLLD